MLGFTIYMAYFQECAKYEIKGDLWMCCAVPYFSKLVSYFWKLDCNWAYFCVGGTVAAFPVVYLLISPSLFFCNGPVFLFAFPIRTFKNANPTYFSVKFLILRFL